MIADTWRACRLPVCGEPQKHIEATRLPAAYDGGGPDGIAGQ